MENGMEKITTEIVAPTLMPVDCLTATDCNAAARAKIITFLVATNVVASRPPERRPTATPTARAKKTGEKNNDENSSQSTA